MKTKLFPAALYTGNACNMSEEDIAARDAIANESRQQKRQRQRLQRKDRALITQAGSEDVGNWKEKTSVLS
jgi:hypothetical protein